MALSNDWNHPKTEVKWDNLQKHQLKIRNQRVENVEIEPSEPLYKKKILKKF